MGQVDGYFQQHRPWSAVGQLAEGAAHQFGNSLDLVDIGSPFGDLAVVGDGIEVGGDLGAVGGCWGRVFARGAVFGPVAVVGCRGGRAGRGGRGVVVGGGVVGWWGCGGCGWGGCCGVVVGGGGGGWVLGGVVVWGGGWGVGVCGCGWGVGGGGCCVGGT